MGLYKAQFISMIIMIALGIGIFVGFNMEWVSIDVNTSSFFEKTNFADFRIISDSGFSEDDLNKVKDIDGVSDVSRFLSVNADVEGQNGDTVALTVTENENVSKPYLISGKEYDAKSENGVWLSDKYAAANGFELGDDITFKYKTIEISGKVEGLIKASEYLVCVRDSSQLMPDYNTHGFAYISPVMYEKAAKMAFYPQINILSSLSKKEMAEKIDAALDKTLLVLSKDENSSYAAQQGEAEEGKTMGSVMPVLFLLIAVLTMVTTMHRLTAKEKTQIGTLKALGFKDKKILRHYTSYAFMIGIIGSALGIGLGYFVAWFLMNPNGSMGTYLDMPEWKLGIPWFCYIILAAIIVLLTLIGFLSVKQMLHGTPADALRPYTPKKVKNLLVEKTKFLYLGPGDMSISCKEDAGHDSFFPTGHYHGITVMIDVEKAPECLSCFLDDVNVSPAALVRKFCGDNGFFVARSAECFEHIFSELYSVRDDIKKGYFKVKVLELLLFLSAMDETETEESSRRCTASQVLLAKKVCAYIATKLGERLTIEELAEKFHVSPTQLKTCYKRVYGVSVYSYIRTQKMLAAERLLKTTDETVLAIANRFGYDNGSKFAKAFRDIIGVSPSEYRLKENY